MATVLFNSDEIPIPAGPKKTATNLALKRPITMVKICDPPKMTDPFSIDL
jgi:hypothetical protein